MIDLVVFVRVYTDNSVLVVQHTARVFFAEDLEIGVFADIEPCCSVRQSISFYFICHCNDIAHTSSSFYIPVSGWLDTGFLPDRQFFFVCT